MNAMTGDPAQPYDDYFCHSEVCCLHVLPDKRALARQQLQLVHRGITCSVCSVFSSIIRLHHHESARHH